MLEPQNPRNEELFKDSWWNICPLSGSIIAEDTCQMGGTKNWREFKSWIRSELDKLPTSFQTSSWLIDFKKSYSFSSHMEIQQVLSKGTRSF